MKIETEVKEWGRAKHKWWHFPFMKEKEVYCSGGDVNIVYKYCSLCGYEHKEMKRFISHIIDNDDIMEFEDEF